LRDRLDCGLRERRSTEIGVEHDARRVYHPAQGRPAQALHRRRNARHPLLFGFLRAALSACCIDRISHRLEHYSSGMLLEE
jgi:hypothetical protein